jgi:hypothetical protein
LKEELTAFCRQEKLQATGNKLELTERIATYLRTGERTQKGEKSFRAKQHSPIEITFETIIETPFVCGEKQRRFFKTVIGKNFTFNVEFQKWLKASAGKTYLDAINAYREIIRRKKSTETVIGRQFEYNTYIRDFFADNKDKSLTQAIACWKHKKSLPGNNPYEKNDTKIVRIAEDL